MALTPETWSAVTGWVHPKALRALLRFLAQVIRHGCMCPTLSEFVGSDNTGDCRTLGGPETALRRIRGVSVLGEALAEWRTEKGWSQRTAANAVDAPPSTWNDWETGEVRPQAKKLRKIAEVFDKSHEEILRLYAESAEETVDKPSPVTAEARMGRMESALQDLSRTMMEVVAETTALRSEIRQLLSAGGPAGGTKDEPRTEAAEDPAATAEPRPASRPTRSRR